MADTKKCPKCVCEEIDLLSTRCPQCNYFFKERLICQRCMGAYPLNQLALINDSIICEGCCKKQEEKEAPKPKAPPPPKNSIPFSAFIPFFGLLLIPFSYKKNKEKAALFFILKPPSKIFYQVVFLLNLLLSTFILYLGGEYYWFSSGMGGQKKVIARLQKIVEAQQKFKEKNNQYGMIEQLTKKKFVELELEITPRQVFVQENGYQFQIYVASRNMWQLKAIPQDPASLELRYYVDHSGKIRYAYETEADEKSPELKLNNDSFFHYLKQNSWLSRAVRHVMASL